MVISSLHRRIGALILAATGLSLGGCQEAVSVGAVNHCGTEVEVQADDLREGATHWTTVRSRDRDSVVDVPENTDMLYVRVRAPGTEESRRFKVPMTSLGHPPTDADYEAQLVLAGDRCP
jgi:hypothetical protein